MLIKKKMYFCKTNNLKQNKMKNNLVKLTKVKQILEQKFEDMEWSMDDRSEKWHESEAAVIHNDKMNAIDTAIMSIDEAIEELKNAFNLEYF